MLSNSSEFFYEIKNFKFLTRSLISITNFWKTVSRLQIKFPLGFCL